MKATMLLRYVRFSDSHLLKYNVIFICSCMQLYNTCSPSLPSYCNERGATVWYTCCIIFPNQDARQSCLARISRCRGISAEAQQPCRSSLHKAVLAVFQVGSSSAVQTKRMVLEKRQDRCALIEVLGTMPGERGGSIRHSHSV